MYRNDNLARKYDNSDIRVGYRRSRELTVGKPSKRNNVSAVMIAKVMAVLVSVLVGSGVLLTKNAQVTEQSNKVNHLKSEYNSLVSDNKKAEVAINQKIDLKTVEELAISNYNMNRAKKSQIVYINVQAEDYGILNVQNNEEENSGTDNMPGIMAYLK